MRWLLLLLFAPAVSATSVAPKLQECPVCGVHSVTMSLMSFSQFGESERDLSDTPWLAYANIDVCPGDLFTSWSSGWEAIKPEQKAKLEVFLKNPALHITDQEKAIIAGNEEEFRKSSWFLLLWARTCDELLDLDEEDRFKRYLWLHYKGKYEVSEVDAPAWKKQLASLYRERAISALKDVANANWPSPTSKRVFAYQRAELIRQAGRKDEALTLFREVIASEKTAKPDEKLEWISRWADEQSLLCSPDAKEPDKSPDAEADNATSARENLEKSWRKDVLLPAIRKAVVHGGMPDVKMPVDESPFANLPPLEDDDAKNTPELNSKELDRELYELWKEQAPNTRAESARIYIRMLKGYEETWEATQYPAMYFLPEMAETKDGREAIEQEFDGNWKSSFWKATCAYAARLPDSGDSFVRHPFTPKADSALVVKLLLQRSDTSWMPEAIKKLNEHEWVSDDIIHYLTVINLPDATAALDQAAADIRKLSGKKDNRIEHDGKLYTLRKIDQLRIQDKFAKLPIRKGN